MGKTIDITGNKYGRWTVLSYFGKNKWGHSSWNCVCECGNTKVVDGKSLRRGDSVSCDCLRKEIISENQFKDLTGQKFGRLYVIEYVGKNESNLSNWFCSCDCGNKKNFSISYLLKKSDMERSCGCAVKEKVHPQFVDLSGQRFGMLLVIKFNGMNKHQQSTWLCNCDCGTKDYVISIASLKQTDRKSCGCLKESYIASELKKYCIKRYNADKKENRNFINPETKHPLPFDIYIPYGENASLNGFYIEVNGRQHYELGQWHRVSAKKNNTTPEEEFEYQKKKDRMKRKFARKNGIYIEIDLRKIKTIEQAMDHIDEIINFC